MKKKFSVLMFGVMLIVVVFAAVVVAVPREKPISPIVPDSISVSPGFQISLRGVENGIAVRQRITARVPRLGRDYRYQWWTKNLSPDTWKSGTWELRKGYSGARFVSLRNLTPGKYRVKVYAKNQYSGKVITAQTQFTVPEPVVSIPRPVVPSPGVPTSLRFNVVLPAGTEYRATIEGRQVIVTVDRSITIPLTIKFSDGGFVIQPVN